MQNLWIQETFVNRTADYHFGESDPYETSFTDRGELFRFLRREYGHCTGKVYIDVAGGPPKAIGWTFEKLDKYEDSKDTYLREVWVTLHSGPAKRSIEYQYAEAAQ